MENNKPERKNPRLKNYDYSSAGAYFVTICTHNRQQILSRIVGRGLAPAKIEYTDYGKVAENQLLLLEKRYPFLRIDAYVIMPDHIHMMIVFEEKAAGASPRPTLNDVVCAYKSLTTKECKRIKPINKIFQVSFYDHVVRGQEDYYEDMRYIEENPLRWMIKNNIDSIE